MVLLPVPADGVVRREGPIPEFIEKYLRAEEVAEFIRMWSIILVPGLLQIRDYALAMYDLPGMDQDKAAATVDAYMDRHSLVEGTDAPQVIAVLDESVLHRLIGTPEVMVRQLDHLLEMVERPNVTIQVARGKGAYWGQLTLDSPVPQAGFSCAIRTIRALTEVPCGRPSRPAPAGVGPLAGDKRPGHATVV